MDDYNQQQANNAARTLTLYLGALRRLEESKRERAKTIAGSNVLLANKVLCKLYGVINLATETSNVGAPQCNYVLETALGNLRQVYAYLGTPELFDDNNPIDSERGKMLHVTEDISAVEDKLTAYAEDVRALGNQVDAILQSVAGENSADMTVFREKYFQMKKRILFLSDILEQYAAIMGHAEMLYREAQVNAIQRANSIPF